ncbi:hypothetical protein C8Q73DRAFT_927 [Cubamyces lactineus]|nr:hypothetical protein C8Q73DRAFT_927 [Cubamyces lactineus]
MPPSLAGPVLHVQRTAPRVDIEDTFGAFLIGTLFGVMLYGMIVHQVYQYFRAYYDGERWNRVLVCMITALETMHVITCGHVCYYYLVLKYDNPEALTRGAWSINLLSVLSGLIIFLSQSYFARRVYLIGVSYRPIVAIASVLLIGELGFFLAATVQADPRYGIHLLAYNCVHCSLNAVLSKWLISVGAAMALIADGLFTCILVTVLRRNITGMKRMDTIVDILIMYAVSTGLLTGIVNLLSFVFSLLTPGNLIYTTFGIVCTKLYANSLLAALNARKYLADRAAGDNLDNSMLNLRATRALSGAIVPRSPLYNAVQVF